MIWVRSSGIQVLSINLAGEVWHVRGGGSPSEDTLFQLAHPTCPMRGCAHLHLAVSPETAATWPVRAPPNGAAGPRTLRSCPPCTAEVEGWRGSAAGTTTRPAQFAGLVRRVQAHGAFHEQMLQQNGTKGP